MPRLLLFIPAYRCAAQIVRTLEQLDRGPLPEALTYCLVLDNCSPDGTYDAARARAASIRLPVEVRRNASNVGLGGSHKIAFRFALERCFDGVIVLHGD